MALIAGTVTVADDGTVTTKTGLAGAIFDALEAEAGPFVPPTLPPGGYYIGSVLTPFPPDYVAEFNAMVAHMAVAQKKGRASQARPLAIAIVGYLTANAAVSIAKDALDSGVPSADRATAGTLT